MARLLPGLPPSFFNHTPPGARQTSWAHVSSRDLVHWERHPDAIAVGPEGAADSGSCGFAFAALDTGAPDCQLRADLAREAGTRAVGLFVRAEAPAARGYMLRIEPGVRTLTWCRVGESGRMAEELSRPLPEDVVGARRPLRGHAQRQRG